MNAYRDQFKGNKYGGQGYEVPLEPTESMKS